MTLPFTDPGETPVNVSRRGFLQGTSGAFVLALTLPPAIARAADTAPAVVPGTRVPAFLAIHPDGAIHLQSPFVEGGQGIFTGMAQLVGEELDADPARFVVENAPVGPDYKVMNGTRRGTGGSASVRTSHLVMRRLGAIARAMLIAAAAEKWGVPAAELTTEPGEVVHAKSGRKLGYGALAARAMDLPVPAPDSIPLKDKAKFRWIGKSVPRLEVRAKSTGRAVYAIDAHVDGMLHAAVQHAPRLGLDVGTIRNEAALKAMKGVHSVHRLPGAVAVVAERFWHARRAVEAAEVEWIEPATPLPVRAMTADFSTEGYAAAAATAATGPGEVAETAGDVAAAFAAAASTISATYRSQMLNHAQLEPPATLARFNPDGTLDIWAPNQSPDGFLADIAQRTGLAPDKIQLHSMMLGGFFGRHFKYPTANPYPQAIALAKATERPVKVIWTREEEFLRDVMRPMAVVQLRAALDAEGWPTALEAVSATEGPSEGIANKRGEKMDAAALEGLTGKLYAIPNRKIAQAYVRTPAMLGYWRSVGHSMNDFFYETFLDEIAAKGGKDPYALRKRLLAGNKRLTTLLDAVVDLSGGWQPGPYGAPDGTRRARGIAMASPFGSETAVIAEVSKTDGEVKVHAIWQAIDPGSVVNPGLVAAQVTGASALGLSTALVEQAVWKDGKPVARNFDGYRVLRPGQMPPVHTRIVESGEKIGGIGEPGLPAVPPAVANALARLTGQPVRAMPFAVT